MNKILRKFLKVIIIILITLFIGIIFFVYSPKTNNPIAKNGVLDLTSWDFYTNGDLSLKGEWEIYWGQLLTPKDFEETSKNKPNLTGYIKVPSKWKVDSEGDIFPKQGFATYRLVIKMNHVKDIFGIKTKNIRMSNKIYADNLLIGESGNPSSDSKYYKSGNTPYTAFFNVQGNEVDLIIQVANYVYPDSGIIQDIYFGLQKDIFFLTNMSSAMDISGALIALFFAVYHLGIYYTRMKDVSFLYFGIYLLTVSILVFFSGEKILMQLFPNLSFEVAYKIQSSSAVLGLLPILLFLKALEVSLVPKNLLSIVKYISIAYQTIIIILPYSIVSYMNNIFWILNGFILLLIYYRVTKAYVKNEFGQLGKNGFRLLLAAIICIIIVTINIILYSNGYVKSSLIQNISYFGLIMFIAILLAYRYSVAYLKMEAMSEKLINIDKLKDEFIAKTSHEIKTPLHGIINISESLLEEKSLNSKDEENKNINLIKNMALSLSNLVNDLLDITRIKNNELKLELTSVDIKVCTEVVFEVFNFIIKGKNIRFINDLSPDILVVADENRIRQVLYNLISNAIKHTHNGTIRIKSKIDGDMVLISVEDTGSGIPKDKHEIIFDAYEKGEEIFDSDHSSLGLGLYISRQLIQRMGGKLFLEWSEVGIGSKFTFSLPCLMKESNSKISDKIILKEASNNLLNGEKDRLEIIRGNRYTILVVDDEISNIHVMLNIFLREGYDILSAFSGEEALTKINSSRIDLVILDVMMPGMSGIDVCRKIREEYSLIDLPILISTVRSSPKDILLGFEAGANDFISKPFDSKIMQSRVKTLIMMKKSFEDALKNEMAFLQAQIKPHFLYNVISTIISLCYTDSESAAKLLSDFSKYLRLTFNIDNTTMLVSLEKEIELTKVYVEIEKVRFGDRIQIEYHIDSKLLSSNIPPLTIQPLVENAIRHGICKKEAGGTVFLSVVQERDKIRIRVKDTGVGISEEKIIMLKNNKKKKSGVGFSNIQKRILKYNEASINIESIENQGTIVEILLPMSI
ncbi:aerobic respiration control sensor protein ArcB [Clostridium homopropionicum DSM 5847]|uniref:Stage 0 sporulation protein A homolog n=1 Tax=Clostridium homopropionicum DSM 5847 TaxID=1121318 RepID=A0A0L6ZD02_9CLOT|nr:ATP-binding protein [Clostridium homopropionicum]KOA20678.1 aerobic respiration control sensor protein ArcB [Clostridium homopropionicum DSM 5847]SFF91684.1 Signal transduction histidine kinase [Clostridium homopropionicum]